MSKIDEFEDLAEKVTLKRITRRNLNAVLKLKVKPKQESLVATNARSIAQAYFYREAWFRAIYLGDAPIGFVLLVDSTVKYKRIKQKNPSLYLWRLMIDEKYQGKGYGQKAVELVINHLKIRPNAKEITLHHEQTDGNAGEFYEKLGFKLTGKILHNELERKLIL
ncbi:MAG: GNAT family N-acetyltransferase [Promethearchaeota archaeon]